MAKLKVAVNISRKWVIGIGLSLTLGSGIAAIQPNGFLLLLGATKLHWSGWELKCYADLASMTGIEWKQNKYEFNH